MEVTRFVVVRGRVQGVGFRWFVRERARRAGVDGWVRNAADGSVEVVMRGAPADVDAMLSTLRDGPPAARVDGVEDGGPPPEPPQSPFAIR